MQIKPATANQGIQKLFCSNNQEPMKHLRVAGPPTATQFPRALLLECCCPLVLLQRLLGRITIGNFSVQSHSSLIGPASSHVADRVATSSQHQHRQIKTFYKLHTLGMTCSKSSGKKRSEEQTFQGNLIISVMPVQHWHCTLLLPLMVRLKQPSLSPDRESDPHCKTTALGWNVSITLDIT